MPETFRFHCCPCRGVSTIYSKCFDDEISEIRKTETKRRHQYMYIADFHINGPVSAYHRAI
jgi:hypothetical protein